METPPLNSATPPSESGCPTGPCVETRIAQPPSRVVTAVEVVELLAGVNKVTIPVTGIIGKDEPHTFYQPVAKPIKRFNAVRPSGYAGVTQVDGVGLSRILVSINPSGVVGAQYRGQVEVEYES
jgi:hypothetical protein